MDLKKQLPTYEPPEKIWENIEASLDQPASLHEVIGELPEYSPPEDLWNDIQLELIINHQPRSRSIFAWRAVAAVLLVGVAICLSWWLWFHDDATIKYTYSEEVIEELHLQEFAETDAESFQLVHQWCEQHPWLCNTHEFRVLKQELEDLKTAKTKLMKAMGNYSDDPDLLTLLSRIERERSEVLKQIVELM